MRCNLPLCLVKLSAVLISSALLLGCPSSSKHNEVADSPPAPDGAEAEGAHAHSHAEGDALTWVKEDVVHEGYELNLGLHGPHLHAGEEAEVAVEIVKDEESVGDAKVFVTLLDESGESVLVEETETVYEADTEGEDPHYAGAKLKIPADAKRVKVRYRITFADDTPEFSSDVLMKAE